MKRRDIIKAFPAIGVASLPTFAQAGQGQEDVCDKIERLCDELADCLSGYLNGQFRAVVQPDGTSWLQRDEDRPGVTRVPVMAARAMREGRTVNVQLDLLADQVKLSAMTIDPSINGCWAAYDFDKNGKRRMSGVFFRREDRPFFVGPEGQKG